MATPGLGSEWTQYVAVTARLVDEGDLFCADFSIPYDRQSTVPRCKAREVA
jgi:hypothetical protein